MRSIISAQLFFFFTLILLLAIPTSLGLFMCTHYHDISVIASECHHVLYDDHLCHVNRSQRCDVYNIEWSINCHHYSTNMDRHFIRTHLDTYTTLAHVFGWMTLLCCHIGDDIVIISYRRVCMFITWTCTWACVNQAWRWRDAINWRVWPTINIIIITSTSYT